MSITTETQVYVDCDCCGVFYATQVATQKEVIQTLRGEGWSFGKDVLCPICARKKRINGGAFHAEARLD